MNTKQQANALRAQNTKAVVDQFGRISYGNYSVEFCSNNTFSIYNRYNSMYDCKDGFKSVTEAVEYIDRGR